MAQRQVRGGVSQSLRQRVRGARIDWVLPRLLQSPPAALEPWRHHTRSRLLPPAAPPHGSLTPADAPLIDAERLFKQPGPPLCSTASVIWVLNFGGFKWMLIADGCIASFISSVALAEEFFEWHRHS